MIDGPSIPKTDWKKKNNGLFTFLSLCALSISLSLYLNSLMIPKVTQLPMPGYSSYWIDEKKSYGNYSIEYLTSGPKLSDFITSCGPTGLPDGGPPENCIVIPYDGKSGIVELRIPTSLIRAFDSSGFSVPYIGQIHDIKGDWYKQLPFQIVSMDNSLTTVRIELPTDSNSIYIIGGESAPKDSLSYTTGVFAIGTLIFIGLAIARVGFFKAIKELRIVIHHNRS